MRMKYVKVGECVFFHGNRYMRIDKRTAKRCYDLNMSFEIIPHGIEQARICEMLTTINKKEWNNKSFVYTLGSMYYQCEMTKSKYFDYYIPVKLIDRFTGKAPIANTPKENRIYVYDNDAYVTLKVV